MRHARASLTRPLPPPSPPRTCLLPLIPQTGMMMFPRSHVFLHVLCRRQPIRAAICGRYSCAVTRQHATGYTTMQEVEWQLNFLRGVRRGARGRGEDGLRAVALVPGQHRMANRVLANSLEQLEQQSCAAGGQRQDMETGVAVMRPATAPAGGASQDRGMIQLAGGWDQGRGIDGERQHGELQRPTVTPTRPPSSACNVQ